MRLLMAKKVEISNPLKSPEDLITSREQTRAGFISMALEKNYMAVPYIEEAKALKILAAKVKAPQELLKIGDLRVGLLTASGLSEKALNYLTEEDRDLAIIGLIEKFLEPAGEHFGDELVYRYLLTKGDALGGKARNLAGSLGERKFLRSFLSVLNLSGLPYKWYDTDSNKWLDKPESDEGIEKRIGGMYWKKNDNDRLLLMNIKVPIVEKNVDLIILQATPDDKLKGAGSIIYANEKYVALGELKGGIDPAGADEHWKTANSALIRIRKSFSNIELGPKTFFVGAAIEKYMAIEIFQELESGILTNAANLSNEDQLTEMSKWVFDL
jgi:type II restriction enzyme